MSICEDCDTDFRGPGTVCPDCQYDRDIARELNQLRADCKAMAEVIMNLNSAYYFMKNSAAGYSNYCEDCPGRTRCEKDYEKAEAIFSAIPDTAKQVAKRYTEVK